MKERERLTCTLLLYMYSFHNTTTQPTDPWEDASKQYCKRGRGRDNRLVRGREGAMGENQIIWQKYCPSTETICGQTCGDQLARVAWIPTVHYCTVGIGVSVTQRG